MRRFYEGKRLTRELTQGSIISHCLADNYTDADNVYGFIITPRCDLVHDAKVAHIHYLPIVDFKDWVKHDGMDYLFNKWNQRNRKQFCEICQKYSIPTDLDSYSYYERIANELIKDLSEKTAFLSCAKVVVNPQRDDEKFVTFCNNKNKEKMVDNLLQDKLAAFYLIEDWNGSGDNFRLFFLES